MLALQLVSPDASDLAQAMLGGGKKKPEPKKRVLFQQGSLHQLASQAKPGDGTGLAAHRLLKQMQRDRAGGES